MSSLEDYDVYEVAWRSGESKLYQDESLRVVDPTNVPLTEMNAVFYAGQTPGTYCYVDWCFIRSYANPEPIQGVWSVAETRELTLSMSPRNLVCRKFGQSISISLDVLDAADLIARYSEISFNATILNYTVVTWGELGIGALTCNQTSGLIRGSIVPTVPASGNHRLLNLTFKTNLHHVWKKGNRFSWLE